MIRPKSVRLGALVATLATALAGAAQAQQTFIDCNGSLFAFDPSGSGVWQYDSSTARLESMCGDEQARRWRFKYSSGNYHPNFESLTCSVDGSSIRVTVNFANGVKSNYLEVQRATGAFAYVAGFGGTRIQGSCKPASVPRPRENLF